jgi:hypothetical protein
MTKVQGPCQLGPGPALLQRCHHGTDLLFEGTANTRPVACALQVLVQDQASTIAGASVCVVFSSIGRRI